MLLGRRTGEADSLSRCGAMTGIGLTCASVLSRVFLRSFVILSNPVSIFPVSQAFLDCCETLLRLCEDDRASVWLSVGRGLNRMHVAGTEAPSAFEAPPVVTCSKGINGNNPRLVPDTFDRSIFKGIRLAPASISSQSSCTSRSASLRIALILALS